jgi:glutamate-ammonia-ligase adenylyltransferase
VTDVVLATLARPRDPGPLAAAVRAMRERIFREHGAKAGGAWNLKHARGGLVEVEFAAQYLVLANAHREPRLLVTSTTAALETAGDAGLLPEGDARSLRDAFALYQSLAGVLRASLDGRFEPAKAPPRLLDALARAAALAVPGEIPPADFAALEARLVATQAGVRHIFDRLCPP